MKKYDLIWVWTCVCLLCLTACQKVTTEDIIGQEPVKDGIVVQFNVTKPEQIPFPTSMAVRASDVKSLCGKVSLAVYQGGTKINQVNQQSGDADFGRFVSVLAPGTYQPGGHRTQRTENPTMTDIGKITFDGKVTDTFYHYSDLTVDQTATHDLEPNVPWRCSDLLPPTMCRRL